MEGPPEGARQDGDATFVVVLWHDPASAVPDQLAAALGSKGIVTTRVTNPFMALAVLCRLSHRAAERPDQTALVILSPERLADAPAVCDAASKYASTARRWMFGPASNPVLRPIVDADVETWRGPAAPMPEVKVVPGAVRAAKMRPATPPPPLSYRASPAGAPALRLTGDGPLDPLVKPADGDGGELAGQEAKAETPRASTLLSAEELRMLLGDDDDLSGKEQAR
jgi:hypothetical protein